MKERMVDIETFPPTGRVGWVVINFLDGAKYETFVYERRALLLLELVCSSLTLWSVTDHRAFIVMLCALPMAVYNSILAQSSRSGATRKRELSEALRLSPLRLKCELELERDAKHAQFLTALQPLVAMVLAYWIAGGSITRTTVITCVVSLLRVGWSNGYGVWRKWMRARRPVKVGDT